MLLNFYKHSWAWKQVSAFFKPCPHSNTSNNLPRLFASNIHHQPLSFLPCPSSGRGAGAAWLSPDTRFHPFPDLRPPPEGPQPHPAPTWTGTPARRFPSAWWRPTRGSECSAGPWSSTRRRTRWGFPSCRSPCGSPRPPWEGNSLVYCPSSSSRSTAWSSKMRGGGRSRRWASLGRRGPTMTSWLQRHRTCCSSSAWKRSWFQSRGFFGCSSHSFCWRKTPSALLSSLTFPN